MEGLDERLSGCFAALFSVVSSPSVSAAAFDPFDPAAYSSVRVVCAVLVILRSRLAAVAQSESMVWPTALYFNRGDVANRTEGSAPWLLCS